MKYFHPNEILPPEIEASYYWIHRLMDDRILNSADELREIYGSIHINTQWNGFYKDSGYRNYDSFKRMYPKKSLQDYFKWASAHAYGKGLDLKFQETSIDTVFNEILEDSQYFYKAGIKRIEDIDLTRGEYQDWLHIDSVNTDYDDIVIVDLTRVYTISEYKKFKYKGK